MSTVGEIIKSSTAAKIWLCPHVVHHPSFSTNNLLRGIECTKSTVPNELLDKEVRKQFKEGGFLCLIWYNSPECEAELKTKVVDFPNEDQLTSDFS